MSLLSRLIGRRPSGAPLQGAFADPAPDTPFAAIGDIHGRADLLNKLLDMIAENWGADLPIVTVGDYVDRGDDSHAVLSHLMQRNLAAPDVFVCLKGNHEDMMLNFLADPAAHGSRWLRNGGLQTMASFGVGGVGENSSGDDMIKAAEAFRTAMGTQMLDWLMSLPCAWGSGNVAVVHAAADPALPIEVQDNHTLMWGHPEFRKTRREDGVWVVHGHVIVPEPERTRGRLDIDTGAYATGRLTAAKISADGFAFLNT